MFAAKQQRTARLPSPPHHARWAEAFLPFPALSTSPPHRRETRGERGPRNPSVLAPLPQSPGPCAAGRIIWLMNSLKGPW